MLYFDKSDTDLVFRLIGEHYTRVEEVPEYANEYAGVERLLGVFEGVQSDQFYPSLEEKAAYLLVQINKGHFFSNGNKRLALVIAIGFLAFNDKRVAESTKEKYTSLLTKLFPSFESFEDQEDFSPDEYALYNISIIIADSHRYVPGNDFESLKEKVVQFFMESLTDLTF